MPSVSWDTSVFGVRGSASRNPAASIQQLGRLEFLSPRREERRDFLGGAKLHTSSSCSLGIPLSSVQKLSAGLTVLPCGLRAQLTVLRCGAAGWRSSFSSLIPSMLTVSMA